MKSYMMRFNHSLACTLLFLCALTASGFAGTKPLSYPKGLAVDAKGNLYVANSGGNDILVYNASYGQMTGKTITAGISNPSAVAIDPYGNVWVANYGTSNGGANGSISEYTGGKQVTSASITDGILGPQQIAVDGLGNVWVQNDYVNITMYDQFGELVKIVSPTNEFIYGLAVSKGWVATGQGSNITYFGRITPMVAAEQSWSEAGNPTSYALAGDDNDNFYGADGSGNLFVFNPSQGTVSAFATPGFEASGLAVDNVHGRLYVANYNANEIQVYNVSNGSLLETIK